MSAHVVCGNPQVIAHSHFDKCIILIVPQATTATAILRSGVCSISTHFVFVNVTEQKS